MENKIRKGITLIICWLIGLNLAAQPCNNNVPSYTINLTGSPAGIWSSPNVSRNSQCCGTQAPNECIYFYLTLDPNAAGIQIDMIGADPAGSLFYQINCTGNYPGGTIKCINGVGPHQITFCKPGSNKNIYKITSISKPLFPKDDTVRLGCKHKFVTLGIVNNSVTWQSIYPGTPGQYNNYLDSANVASPTYSPGTGAPPYIDYRICGFPIASGCGFSLTVCDTVRVYNFPGLTATVTPNPATFCNNGPGSGVNLTASASGGAPSYSFTWKNTNSVTVGTGTNYFASAAGIYNLEVKDLLYDPVECPASYTSVSVSQGTVPTVDAGPSQKKCYNNPIATLNGTVQYASGGIWTGGAGTYSPGNTYLNTAYSPSPSELLAGFVKLYLTTTGAGGGCINKTDSLIIYYPPLLTAAIPSASIACFNGTTGLNSNINGGTAPYAFLWNTGSTNPSINAGQGNFSLIVTDSLGCTASTNINLVSPPALNINFNVSNVTINGGNDGSATVTPSGGNPAYTVTWSPGGSNSFSINNLVYGVYTATVTDANGCHRIGSTIVNEPRCLAFSAISAGTNVSCYGAGNGVASVTVSGGTPAYSYTWNTVPPQNTSMAANLNAGVYSVLIKDANNCFQTANATITEPAMLTNVITHTNVSVIGGNNGAAAANPFGGTAPYSYLWSNGPTTSSVSGLTAGIYSVTVTDNKGCTKNDNVNITQPPCNGLTINVFKTNVSCFGGNNGSALAVITGANGSYTVNWSNGNTGLSVSNLAAGNYSVMVTNSNNCSEYVNFTITQPTQLSFGMVPTNISCFGNGNGSIDLTLSGGTYPYSYSWSNGSTAEDQVNLAPGTYSVQMSDANGCSALGTAIITQPSSLNITYTIQNVSCIYGNNGAIGLNVSGGTLPFTYTWSNGATTQSISNLAAGGYSVLVKDANNCTIAQPLFIPLTQPDSVRVDSFIVACSVPGSNQTQVTIVPQGGNPGLYQVSFNNGVTYQSPGVYSAMLINGTTYTVVLKDVSNCVSLLPKILNVLTEVKIDSISFGKCYPVGTTSTNVSVYSSGGDNGPYSVSFDNGVTYLPPGTYSAGLAIASAYSVIVKDARGCVSAMHIIGLPSAFSASTGITSNYNGQNISCFGLTNGSALVTANGGSGTYTYTWSTVPQQTTAASYSLGAGTYSVQVKDGNNCSITSTITLTQPAQLTSSAAATSNYNGQNISCFGYADGSASVTPNGGTIPYNYVWSSVPTQSAAAAFSLSAGVYSVVVTDINNCTSTSTVSLSQPAAITSTVAVISNYNGQQVTCFGATNGSATVSAGNGTGPYTYTWSTVPAQTGTLAVNLGAGSYSVIVTDANGCSITKTISLNQPSQLTTSSIVTSNYNGQNISCFGMADGSASTTINGGTGPYTFTWNTVPVQTAATATNLVAGIYTVNVSDVNGCSSTSTVTLTQPAAVNATAAVTSNYNGQNISCFGLTNGSALVTATGGTGAYSYTWNSVPQQTTAAAINLGAGTFTVTVKDINNCTITSTVILTQPAQLTASAIATSSYNGQNISCFGYADGSASVTSNGGTMPYGYLWSSVPTQSTAAAFSLTAGVYSVVVTDINNCTSTSTVSLSQPAAITSTAVVISNYNGQQVTCFGATNGSATAVAGNGTGPYTYTWSTVPVQTGTLATSLGAGTYSIVITDANGCAITKTITVTQPSQISSTASVVSNFNGQNISCFGMTDGTATAMAVGGTGPYTYAWSTIPVQTAATATNLAAGVYTVNVNDVNGCASASTVTLTQPAAFIATLSGMSNYNGYQVSCFGNSNGYINISLSGGIGAYTYSWSNGAVTQNINNIGAGNYSVIATDANGCTSTLTVSAIQPPQLVANVDSLSNYGGYNIKCHGNNNGSIYVSVNGGVPTYTYSWSDGDPNQVRSGMSAGSYTLTVTDMNNCFAQVSATLTEPPAMQFSSAVSQPLCNGVSNGSINITTGGGVLPFTYNWSNGATTEDLGNITAGTYTVIFTDKNGCRDSAVVSVTQPQTINLVKNVNGLKCNGDSIGAIRLNVNGGTQPYTYQWSNGSTVKDQTDLKTGTYSILITDANGCVLADTTLLSQPNVLQLSLYSPLQFDNHNISYPNGNDGSIDLTVSGGTAPYSYLWSNSSTSQNLSNIPAGTYSVNIADNNGCKISGGIILTEPYVLEMPTGFSPNNDGKNDYFVVHGIEAYPQNQITIYNRWGNIIYSKSGYNNEWNGTSNNGNVSPDATYFVILEINSGEKVLKGFVELRR